MKRLLHGLGRIRVRLFAVMVVVLLVPIAGLEFARTYERQLLDALERDMRNQATLVRSQLQEELLLRDTVDWSNTQRVIERAASQTRTRIRVLAPTADPEVMADSHIAGPPEGPEGPPPLFERYGLSTQPLREARSPAPWPSVSQRREVQDAFSGKRSAFTRVRERHPDVLLFVSEPVRVRGEVRAVVYVTRSTQPVLLELHRVRRDIVTVLAAALVLCLGLALLLAWTISRPLGRLSRAAAAISSGRNHTPVPLTGSGEIRELAVALRAMTKRLEERAQANADFAADVAHEFKSPLTSIRGAAELLREGAADEPEARDRFLGNILIDAERLDRLVSRLLELSRLEASTTARSNVDLEKLLRRLVRRIGRDEQPVEFRYQASQRFIPLREAEFELAIGNVVENAVRFSPVREPVVVDVTEAGGKIVIAVRNRGPAIAAGDLSRVFDRFFTTDAERNGTGLGLAIAKTVIESHGGTIAVESEAGETTFTIGLEARAEE